MTSLAQIYARIKLDEGITFALGRRDVMKLVIIDRLSKSMHVSIQYQLTTISKGMVQNTVTSISSASLPSDTTFNTTSIK